MKKTKQTNNQKLAEFYTNLGWKIVSESSIDGRMTYNLEIAFIDEDQLTIESNLTKGEKILKKMLYWAKPFPSYWFNNVLLFLGTIVIFLTVTNKYDLLNNGEFSWPLLGETFGWSVVYAIVLFLTFVLSVMFYQKYLSEKIFKLGAINRELAKKVLTD